MGIGEGMVYARRRLRSGNTNILTNLAGEELVDFTMPRNGGRLIVLRIVVDAVPAAFAKEAATTRFHMPDEVLPLHATVRAKGSLETLLPANDLSANSRLASKTSCTASLRFSRASSSIAPACSRPATPQQTPHNLREPAYRRQIIPFQSLSPAIIDCEVAGIKTPIGPRSLIDHYRFGQIWCIMRTCPYSTPIPPEGHQLAPRLRFPQVDRAWHVCPGGLILPGRRCRSCGQRGAKTGQIPSEGKFWRRNLQPTVRNLPRRGRQGTVDSYPQPLAGDKSPSQLAAFIDASMPEDDPGTCVGDDAKSVAAYVYDSFYSAAAQATTSRRAWNSRRVTANQYVNLVTDLMGNPYAAPPRDAPRRLRGFYSGRHRVEDQVRDDPPVEQVDPCIDFDFGSKRPVKGKIATDEYRIYWQGACTPRRRATTTSISTPPAAAGFFSTTNSARSSTPGSAPAAKAAPRVNPSARRADLSDPR